VTAIRTDYSFRRQIVVGTLLLFGMYVVFGPLSHLELFALVLAWMLVLITELQNSSFETALDRLHPEEHAYIGKSKDMAAGAVLLAGVFTVFVVCLIAWSRLAS
jgi:diacylglycerol kinase